MLFDMPFSVLKDITTKYEAGKVDFLIDSKCIFDRHIARWL